MPGAWTQADLEHHVNQINERLRAIEEQLARISDATGIPYARPGAGMPDEVVELVRAGNRIGAVKRYRELTGSSLADAQTAVESI